MQRQVKSLYCAANKLRGTFDQCSPAVKNTYFVPIACQRMLASCGADTRRPIEARTCCNAYRIMHYIPRNISVRPHQVSHCVRTFDAVLRNNLYRFFIRCTFSSNLFIRSLQMSDAFNKSSFFLNYSTLLYGEQMQQLSVNRRLRKTPMKQRTVTTLSLPTGQYVPKIFSKLPLG